MAERARKTHVQEQTARVARGLFLYMCFARGARGFFSSSCFARFSILLTVVVCYARLAHSLEHQALNLMLEDSSPSMSFFVPVE